MLWVDPQNHTYYLDPAPGSQAQRALSRGPWAWSRSKQAYSIPGFALAAYGASASSAMPLPEASPSAPKPSSPGWLDLAALPLTEPLWPFQAADVAQGFLGQRAWGEWAQVGLGKTMMALSAYHILKTHKLVDGILVIGPESARHGWIGQSSDSIVKFNLEGHLVTDGKKPLPRSGLIYCSVDKTWRPKYAAELLRRIKTGRWVLCCDEGHQLSPGSKRYAAVDLWASFCPWRWILTGTPIANYPDRFFSMWRLLTRNDCTYPQWVEWFCKLDGTWHKQRLLWLQEHMKRISRVRTRQEVAPDLPVTTVRTISVPLEGEQRLAYGELLRGAMIGYGGNGDRMEWLGALARLSSICSHHELQEGERRPSARVAKLEVLEGLLEGSGDAQAIIWSWHPGTLDWLARVLPCTSVTYHGGTSQRDRERAIQLFNSGERRLFLGNPSAAGVGLNLPNADIRVFFDSDFSTVDYVQSAGRNERGLMHDPKIEYRLVAQGTVEEMAWESQVKKENLRALVLGGKLQPDVVGKGIVARWRACG